MDVDELFAQADAARREVQLESGDADLEGDEWDASAVFVNAPCATRTSCVTYSVGPDGDIHACPGMQCKHVVLNGDNHYVCGISGQVLGAKSACESYPGSTGRSIKSANPDDTAGMPVGGWVKRRDMYAASVQAFRNASAISDAEIAPAPAAPLAAPPVVKRGALCVDEAPDANVVPKRTRNSRKDNWTRDAIDKLAAEALTVIDKLFIAQRKPQELQPPPDPRLQNLEFVKRMAIRKYVKRCDSGESELNLDVLSNVIIHANEFVREQRAAAVRRLDEATQRVTKKRQRSDAGSSGQIRNQLSQLIVSLWRASCMTKHFMTSKKGNDSFRPFAAGILYSLKRGLYLPDGTCVVPVLDELAAHLPALRSASSTPAARQLQSSSHRGICSMQRALTSLSEMGADEAQPARTLLRDASRQGAFLRELVSRNS